MSTRQRCAVVMVLALVWAGACAGASPDLVIQDDTLIQDGDSYNAVTVEPPDPFYMPGHVVDMTGGSISVFHTENAEEVSISGGTIEQFFVESRGVRVSDGNITSAYAEGSWSEMFITGGQFGNNEEGWARTRLSASGGATIHISGGSISELWCYNNQGYGTAHIYGYQMAYASHAISHIDPVGGGGWGPPSYYWNGLLTGYWQDGTPFEIEMAYDELTFDHVTLHEVPEPASALLFVLAAGIVRRRSKKD